MAGYFCGNPSFSSVSGKYSANRKSTVLIEDNFNKEIVKLSNTDLSYSIPTIVIARHGRPALSKKVWLTAGGFRNWWKKYDESGLDANQKAPRKLLNSIARCSVVVASPLKRAVETAQAVVGDKGFIKDDIFVEAPLPPPELPDFVKFKPKIWGFISRCTWFVGMSGGMESHEEAKERAKQAADLLDELATKNGSVALLAHGWFNRMIRPNLKKNGWVCVYDGGDFHWSHRIYQKKIN